MTGDTIAEIMQLINKDHKFFEELLCNIIYTKSITIEDHFKVYKPGHYHFDKYAKQWDKAHSTKYITDFINKSQDQKSTIETSQYNKSTDASKITTLEFMVSCCETEQLELMKGVSDIELTFFECVKRELTSRKLTALKCVKKELESRECSKSTNDQSINASEKLNAYEFMFRCCTTEQLKEVINIYESELQGLEKAVIDNTI